MFVAGLCVYMVAYGLDLGRIDKRALHTVEGAVMREQHVAAPYQLVCTGAVEDCFRVDHLRYAECDTAGEVGLDNAGDYVGRRALGCDNHMHPHGTCLLCDTCNRLFHLFPCGHNKVGELIHNHDDVGEVAMPFFRVEALFDKPFVVFGYGAYVRIAQQHITLIHLHAERVKGGQDLIH